MSSTSSLGAILVVNAETAELLLARNPIDLVQLKEIVADIRRSDQHAAGVTSLPTWAAS